MFVCAVVMLFQCVGVQLTSCFGLLLTRPRQVDSVSVQRLPSVWPSLLVFGCMLRPERTSDWDIRQRTPLSHRSVIVGGCGQL